MVSLKRSSRNLTFCSSSQVSSKEDLKVVIVTRLPKHGTHMPKHIGKWLQEQTEHGWGIKVSWAYAAARVHPKSNLFSDGHLCPIFIGCNSR